MSKALLPEQWPGVVADSSSSAKQAHGLEWSGGYSEKRAAARQADRVVFPVSASIEYRIRKKKEARPDWFKDLREENRFRLLEHFKERFEIFEADVRDFEELWLDMGNGAELWSWIDRIDGAHTFHRMQDFEAMMKLLMFPLKKAKEQAQEMRKQLELYFEATEALLRLNMGMDELENEYQRRYKRTHTGAQ